MKHYLGIELKLADFEITHWLLWQNEWWKPVLDYDGYYEASTLGRVRTIDRVITFKNGVIRKFHSHLCKQHIHNNGYLTVTFCKKNIVKQRMVHRVIIEAFYGYKELTVNHKKHFNKTDNRLQNLEYLTQRDNSRHYFETKNRTSNINGVSYNKQAKRWRVFIRFLGKQYYLGGYKTEQEAIEIQQIYFPLIITSKDESELKGILNNTKVKSQFKGTSVNKSRTERKLKIKPPSYQNPDIESTQQLSLEI